MTCLSHVHISSNALVAISTSNSRGAFRSGRGIEVIRATRAIETVEGDRVTTVTVGVDVASNALRGVTQIPLRIARFCGAGGIEVIRGGGTVEAEERDSSGLLVPEYVARDPFAGVSAASDSGIGLVIVGSIEVINDLTVEQAIEWDGAIAVTTATLG